MRYILLFLCLNGAANAESYIESDQQLIKQSTSASELKLLNKYTVIRSEWFEKYCLDLIDILKFTQLTECKAIDSKHINAYVLTNGHVYFSMGLLSLLNNRDQMASILAHENAHIELHHYLQRLRFYKNPPVFFTGSKLKKINKTQEQDADQWADNTLNEHGFDANQISYFLKRVIQFKGNKKSSSHYQSSKRIKKNSEAEKTDALFIKYIQQMNEY